VMEPLQNRKSDLPPRLSTRTITATTQRTQYFANLRYPDRASPPENPHKSERSIWVAGIPSCLSPKGRGQPAV